MKNEGCIGELEVKKIFPADISLYSTCNLYVQFVLKRITGILASHLHLHLEVGILKALK